MVLAIGAAQVVLAIGATWMLLTIGAECNQLATKMTRTGTTSAQQNTDGPNRKKRKG